MVKSKKKNIMRTIKKTYKKKFEISIDNHLRKRKM